MYIFPRAFTNVLLKNQNSLHVWMWVKPPLTFNVTHYKVCRETVLHISFIISFFLFIHLQYLCLIYRSENRQCCSLRYTPASIQSESMIYFLVQAPKTPKWTSVKTSDIGEKTSDFLQLQQKLTGVHRVLILHVNMQTQIPRENQLIDRPKDKMSLCLWSELRRTRGGEIMLSGRIKKEKSKLLLISTHQQKKHFKIKTFYNIRIKTSQNSSPDLVLK